MHYQILPPQEAEFYGLAPAHPITPSMLGCNYCKYALDGSHDTRVLDWSSCSE